MGKKLILSLFLLILYSVSMKAVLKEKDLPQTLANLRVELQKSYDDKLEQEERFRNNAQMMNRRVAESAKTSSQIALMLYSQKRDYVFDVTYACSEAMELYRNFSKQTMPFTRFETTLDADIERYKELINSLESIPEFILETNEQKADRNECLRTAKAILEISLKQKANMKEAESRYDNTKERLAKMNDYATKRYQSIKDDIFRNGDYSYPMVLSMWKFNYQNARNTVEQKYVRHRNIKSQWNGPIYLFLFSFLVSWLIIASIISYIAIRFFIPKKIRTREEFIKKRTSLIQASAAATFAIVAMIIRYFASHNFFIMASGLLIEYFWLVAAILISLIVRVPGDCIRRAFRLYAPVLVLGFIIIVTRILFVPNEIVNLIYSPIIIIMTIWQVITLVRSMKNVPRYDIICSWVSAIILFVTAIMAWVGFVLMAVQVLIWWLFMLTFIQTITAIYDILEMVEKRYLEKRISKAGGNLSNKHQGYYIRQTWFFDFITKCVTPILTVLSIPFSLLLASEVFDFSDWVIQMLRTPFVEAQNILTASLQTIFVVICLFFVFRYLHYLLMNLYLDHDRRRNKESKVQTTLGRNLIAIGVWGIYILLSMTLLKVNQSGIAIITAGLSTGVGFAMKDLLENFFYGMSLMTGRIRVGDVIQCEGVRGTVESITYQSTQVHTFDGAVISFPNSQLFTKNFQNLTKSDKYEKMYVPIGVAYGSDLPLVKEVLTKELTDLLIDEVDSNGDPLIRRDYGVKVVMQRFGDSSVDMVVLFWMLVKDEIAWIWKVREHIYKALNDHHIEIPFPQRDIHVRDFPQLTQNLQHLD
ncbi:MAG: mechanosensitive ion channel [Bacteroidaceae bacterium]|nr:mechanosensitive ion channel [Bacteroidaceae bacterium]